MREQLAFLVKFYGAFIGLAFAFAALTIQCSKPTAPLAVVVITYTLKSIDNMALPWAFDDSLKVYAGKIILTPSDTTYRDILTYDFVFSARRFTRTDTLVGRYRITPGIIEFRGPQYAQALYSEHALTFLYDHPWVYAR